MKKEIRLETQENYFDIAIEDGDFANCAGFDTAIWTSLFTDARADSSQILKPEDRRGWLGNTISEFGDTQLGGLLWLADQRRLTQDTLNEVVDYIRKSLNWFVSYEIALKVEVSGAIIPKSGIEVSIKITSLDGVTTDYLIELWRYTGAA